MLKSIPLKDARLNLFHAGQGSPLVFVHGFPLEHGMWQAQLDEFQHGYQVIAPDLRGFGKSDGTRELCTMADFADDLVHLLDAMNISEPVTLCGLSMGGYIAWQFALKHRSRLQRLVLCDTRARNDDAEGQQRRRDLARRVLLEGTSFLARDMPDKLYSPLTLQSAPELVEQTRRVILQTDPRAVAAASLGMAERPDVTSLLSQIDVPTLVVCGTDDAIVSPEEMRSFAEALPHAEFEVIPGAGHMAPQEHPQAFNARLRDFLAATDR